MEIIIDELNVFILLKKQLHNECQSNTLLEGEVLKASTLGVCVLCYLDG